MSGHSHDPLIEAMAALCRRTHKKCHENGYKLNTSSKGSIQYEKRTNVPDNFEDGKLCSWIKVLGYWKEKYPKLVICRTTANICTTCYEFHIANRQCKNRPTELTPYESTASDKDETDNDHDSSDNGESADNEGEEKTLEEIERKEKELFELTKHVKEAASMRKMAQDFTKEEKDHSVNDENHGTILCAIANYGRNMEMPSLVQNSQAIHTITHQRLSTILGLSMWLQ
jgi:hypothetical protein